MKTHAIKLLIIALLAAGCASEIPIKIPMPGRIPSTDLATYKETCSRITALSRDHSGFKRELRDDCEMALAQVTDYKTTLEVFDVARAYLDGLHEFANTADFLAVQGKSKSLSSDYGAYLVARHIGLISAMRDWRYESQRPPGIHLQESYSASLA